MRALLAALMLALPALAQAAPEDELRNAALRDDGNRVMLLMLHGADPNAVDAQGRAPLHIALKEESERALRSLLEYPALDVNRPNAAGETPLMLAALRGRLDWVQLLVKRGAAINRAGWTALHYACSGPDEGVVAWLLSQGAVIDARSPNGSTPLMLASGYGGLTAAEQLLAAGADPRLANEQGLVAADFAERAGRDKFAKRLREAADKR